jgi:hypothetical protein
VLSALLKSLVNPLADDIGFVDEPIRIVSVQTFDANPCAGNTTVRSWSCVICGYRTVAFGGVALVG